MQYEFAISSAKIMRQVVMKTLHYDDSFADYDITENPDDFSLSAYHNGYYAYIIFDYRIIS